MADSKPSIHQLKVSINSSASLTSTKRSSSFSCVSGDDVSDDYRESIPRDKKKTKKKPFKLFEKRRSEIRDADSTVEQKQNNNITFKQRLTNLFRKKDSKQYKFSHSKSGDDGNAFMDIDGSCTDISDFENRTKNDNTAVFPETTEDFARRHLMMDKNSDRSAEKEVVDDKLSPRVIHVKSNSPVEECIETQHREECQLETEEHKSKLEERLQEISRREEELSRKEDEISRREKEVLTSQQNTIETLNEVARIIGNIAQNPRYVNISQCKSIKIGTGDEDVKQNLESVCNILDSLCEKYEDIKNTTEKTLESVKDLQKESTDHREQLHNLEDFLESKLRHHTVAEGLHQIPTPSNNVQEQGQICNTYLSAPSKPSNNIWGPSNVHDFVVSSQVALGKDMKQVLTDVQLLTKLLSQSETLNCNVAIKTRQRHTQV
ncbi:uncharacterized protein LOC117330180 [Pecten maximus]|uniref:uncharacterized protein LOC117330180 n=1 Tax=Pecten maximus TaxID=6579 RepID=UPI0014583D79|nr:uncharacterized protein LOC117330180 [Pecten maximus]